MQAFPTTDLGMADAAAPDAGPPSEPDAPAEPDAGPETVEAPPAVTPTADCPGGCDDGDACTEDVCDAVLGCMNYPIEGCCVPDCAGKSCGSDGCGGVCGECGLGESCVPPGVCETLGCVPDCTGKECGDNGCGESCGMCPSGWTCDSAGMCEQDACVPSCGGAQCGGDGCGGSCGTCPGSFQCQSGTCVDTSPPVAGNGNTCQSPFVISAVPFTTSNDTTGADNNSWFESGDCPGVSLGKGEGSRDQVYSITVAQTGDYRIDVDSEFGYDAVVYVASGCPGLATSCIAAVDDSASGLETLFVSLSAGVPYFIVVDGWGNVLDEHGTYTLSVQMQ